MEATVTQSATVDISALADIVAESKDILSKGYRMVSAYKEEQSINNDYRGRQLLELIQNADDAGSAYVSISLDTESRILRIENEGDPFTTEGYRSLMIPNLSSKRKKKYIGNKGLGFRSILNWSNKVTINSGGVVVAFSRELAQSWFENLYPEEAQRLSVLTEFQYPAESIPFPIFSIPDITPIEEVQPLTTNRSGGNWSSGGNYSGGGYTGDEDKERQELGRRSEIEVFEALKKKYPNGQVEWVSEYSDYYVDKGNKWGYDIKYRISSEAEWYYVEVKSFYKGSFFFTTHELNTAIDNEDTYYIFLVDDDKISEIQFNQFLNDEGELMVENSYFSIKVNDYKFTKP